MTSVDYAGLGVGAFIVLAVVFVGLSVLLERRDARRNRKVWDKYSRRAPSVSMDPRDGYALDDPKLRAFDGRW